jgi:hypothetical protein
VSILVLHPALNIRLGLKWLTLTNALAYNTAVLINEEKVLLQGPRRGSLSGENKFVQNLSFHQSSKFQNWRHCQVKSKQANTTDV